MLVFGGRFRRGFGCWSWRGGIWWGLGCFGEGWGWGRWGRWERFGGVDDYDLEDESKHQEVHRALAAYVEASLEVASQEEAFQERANQENHVEALFLVGNRVREMADVSVEEQR